MKNFVGLYGVVYGISCVFKMINNSFILVTSRILSGIGTSLLFSVVESWMVKVHKKRGYPENALVKTFSEATFVNGITAVVAGVVASFFSDSWGFDLGFKAPFALGALDLVLMVGFVWVMWPSDHLLQDSQGSPTSPSISSTSPSSSGSVPVAAPQHSSLSLAAIRMTLSTGFNDMLADKKIVFLCVVQSLFEGAMSIFVFVWTPTLLGECSGDEFKFASLGWIFASFMVAIMVGSQLFEYLTNTGRSVNWIARINFAVAAVAMLISCIAAALSPDECKEYSTATAFAYVGFAVFEMCCGVYFPVISTLKSIYLPERSRAALMNFARIGLNGIIIVVLMFAGVLSNSVILFLCMALLVCACLVQVFKLPISNSVQSYN